MIAAWMLLATLFGGLLALAALAAERALRTMGREGRAPWIAAIAAGTVWPLIAPFIGLLLPARSIEGGTSLLPVVTTTIGAVTTIPAFSPTWLSRLDMALAALWGAASVLLFVRFTVACRAVLVAEREAAPREIAGVSVLVTPSLGPAAFGLRRPRLLVPRWLLEFEAPLRALVIRHEEEHRRVRDPQLRMAVAIAVAMVPWNLAVWWIARRLRLAMELDCDARVLRTGSDPQRYGRLLLLIAQRQSRAPVAALLAESNSDLSRRITAMQTPRPTHPHLRVAVLGLGAAIALACSSEYASDLATDPGKAAPATPTMALKEEKLFGAHHGSRFPVFPSDLRMAGIEGIVKAAFVVDTNGQVLPGSLKIIESTHALFSKAVEEALPGMRFTLPELDGRKVRRLVEQPFVFQIATARRDGETREVPVPRSVEGSSGELSLRPVFIIGVSGPRVQVPVEQRR